MTDQARRETLKVRGMSKEEIYERYCDHCEADTQQRCIDSGHERDSSGDYQECLVCGWHRWGFGDWQPPEIPPYTVMRMTEGPCDVQGVLKPDTQSPPLHLRTFADFPKVNDPWPDAYYPEDAAWVYTLTPAGSQWLVEWNLVPLQWSIDA